MKRFIRTKANKFYDLSRHNTIIGKEYLQLYLNKKSVVLLIPLEDIVAESDYINDLIQVGDIVKAEKFNYCIGIEKDPEFKGYDYVNKIYTKQGDNYILVWDKERGVIE